MGDLNIQEMFWLSTLVSIIGFGSVIYVILNKK